MKRSAFTLIELVVVLVIIILITALILQTVNKPKKKSLNNPLEAKIISLVNNTTFVYHNDSGLVFAVCADHIGWQSGYAAMTIVPTERVAEISHLIINLPEE